MTTLNEWQPMDIAPKTGRIIEINYGTPENPEYVQLAFWSERPVCMGSPTVYNEPGWATASDDIDKNLPLDEPNYWREEI